MRTTRTNSGTLVQTIIASGDPSDGITDADGDPEGIAIIGVDESNGTWWYRTTSTGEWISLSGVSDTNAVVLYADAETSIRFDPNVDYYGTVDSGITFRAWDRTDGLANGTTGVDITGAGGAGTGGTSPFSTATETAGITVNPVGETYDFYIYEDVTATLTLEAVYSDSAGGTVKDYRFELVGDTGSGITTAHGGTVVLVGDPWEGNGTYYQKVTYTPAADYNNDIADSDTWDSFQFRFGVTEKITVDGDFDGATSVYSADVDGDGDLDIIGAAAGADDITWWENTAGDGSAWTKHVIDGDFDGATSVYAADVDGDGDLDVLGAANSADDITWWENTAGDGSSWTEHVIDGDFDGATSVYAADVDGDGDVDVIGASANDAGITWWENTAGDGSAWTEHVIDDAFFYARSVYSADVDGDGDLDVIGAASGSGYDITWWRTEATDLHGPNTSLPTGTLRTACIVRTWTATATWMC